MRVLVVDDNGITGSTLADLLRKDGTVVEWATNAAAARTKLKVFVPDAIVLDYFLGDGTADLLLDEIRQDAKLRDVPVVLTTAAGGEDFERIERLPHRIMRKPFTAAELMQVLHEVAPAKGVMA